LVANRAQLSAKNSFPVLYRYQLQIHADKIFVGRKQIKAFHFRMLNGLLDFSVIDKDVVDRHHVGQLLDSQTACGISLRVGVYEEYLNFAGREGRCEVYRGSSLPDPALLVCYCDYSAQRVTVTRLYSVGVFTFDLNVSRETFTPVFHVKH